MASQGQISAQIPQPIQTSLLMTGGKTNTPFHRQSTPVYFNFICLNYPLCPSSRPFESLLTRVKRAAISPAMEAETSR